MRLSANSWFGGMRFAFPSYALLSRVRALREEADGPHQAYRVGDRRSRQDRRVLQTAFRPDRALPPADRYWRKGCVAQRWLYLFRDPEIRLGRCAETRA